jgi:hypothetical protein
LRYGVEVMKNPGRTDRSSGGAFAKLLFVIVVGVACALAYQNRTMLLERASEIQSEVMGKKENSPADAAASDVDAQGETALETAVEAVDPAPAVEPVAAEPAEPEVAAAPAEPAPVVAEEPPNYAAIAATRTLWPKQVALTKAVPFPLILDGKVVGHATVPVGMVLGLSRVIGGAEESIEVIYNGSKQVIPVSSTDLIQRAAAIKKVATEKSAVPAPVPGGQRVASAPVSRPMAAAVAAAPAAGSSVKAGERITLEVVRRKLSRIEGGDWDDKKDRISLRVKFANSDSKLAFENYEAEVYTFAQSILDPRFTKLLGKQTFKFSLPPFGKHEVATDECVTAYDTTDARFGHQYQGWIVRIRDAQGNLVIEKATTPSLAKAAEKLVNLRVNEEINR